MTLSSQLHFCWTLVLKMNSKLIFWSFLFFSFFGFGISFNNPQIELTEIFSKENSPEFLRRLSFENISQQCSDHTQVFQKKLTENPIAGLNDGFWELKSKNIFKVQ